MYIWVKKHPISCTSLDENNPVNIKQFLRRYQDLHMYIDMQRYTEIFFHLLWVAPYRGGRIQSSADTFSNFILFSHADRLQVLFHDILQPPLCSSSCRSAWRLQPHCLSVDVSITSVCLSLLTFLQNMHCHCAAPRGHGQTSMYNALLTLFGGCPARDCYLR